MKGRLGRLFGRFGALLLALALVTTLTDAPAMAQSLKDLRASGAVGERFDGLLELRDPGASGAKRVVNKVNGERRQIYEKDAAAQGVPVTEVGKIYATKIWRKVPKGTWLLEESGNWRRK
jgi:uncharacterized protein YdbL (DUF1318 family)